MTATAAAIIPAAGQGLRMGSNTPKQFLELAGRPLFIHALLAFQQVAAVKAVVLVVPAAQRASVERLLAAAALPPWEGQLLLADGGRLRQDSVRAGLEALPFEPQVVLVHDGVRPFVSAQLIESCIGAALEKGAVIAAVPVKDTIKKVVASGAVAATVDRSDLWQAQTPQAMRTELLRQAMARALADGFEGTDEASLLEHIGVEVAVLPGSERNIKITRPEDLVVARALMEQRNKTAAGEPLAAEQESRGGMERTELRVGHGYDAHRLVAGRDLVLGGVVVPHELGLLGHSDADVLTHALCDAILGAVGGGDIGRHFPDSDPQYKGISSLLLLERVVTHAAAEGWRLVNADVTVVAQRPKLAPFLAEMRRRLATACQVQESALNLKATTTEKMGFAGREEGIAAHAVVLMGRG